nr:uncharacterized protein LOC121120648 [Lepeophtheirus salmonis]
MKEEMKKKDEEETEGIHPTACECGVRPTAQPACSLILTALQEQESPGPVESTLDPGIGHFGICETLNKLTFPPPKTSIGPVFLINFDISTRCFGRHRPYPLLHHSTGKRWKN